VTLYRLDRNGRDVTNMPGLWDESDCEIMVTQFAHPSITSGQHTNGPASIWIRMPDRGIDWIRSQEGSLHKTVKAWVDIGIDWFQLLDAEVQQ
jgi:hypothetical protein